MSSIASSLSLSITILSSKEHTVDCSATYKDDTERISTALAHNSSIFYWNDTEKNSMDRRKDDMCEPRNVVKFFPCFQWSRQALSGPSGPSDYVRRPQA